MYPGSCSHLLMALRNQKRDVGKGLWHSPLPRGWPVMHNTLFYHPSFLLTWKRNVAENWPILVSFFLHQYGHLDRFKRKSRRASPKANEDATLHKLDLYPLWSQSPHHLTFQLSHGTRNEDNSQFWGLSGYLLSICLLDLYYSKCGAQTSSPPALPGMLSEIQNLKPCSRPTESECAC